MTEALSVEERRAEMPPREGHCQQCGHEHPPWFGPDDLWNCVAGDAHFLCPTCFINRVEASVVEDFVWRVEPDEYRRAFEEDARAALRRVEAERDRLVRFARWAAESTFDRDFRTVVMDMQRGARAALSPRAPEEGERGE